MLIIDTRNELYGDAALEAWPGPIVRYFAHDCGHKAEDDGRSVDFIDTGHPASRLDTLRQIVLTGQRYRAAYPTGPLLVLLGRAADGTARKFLTTRPGRLRIEYSLDEASELSTLFCAESVVRHPSFFDFFRNMSPGLGAVHSRPSLDVFVKYLGA